MIKEYLKRFERPDMPLLGPNYWLLRTIGLILPDNKLLRVPYIVMHEMVVYFVITQYMELYGIVLKSDLDEALTNIKISILSVVCVSKANAFVFWQNKWRALIKFATESDKYEREHQDEVTAKILDSYTKYCRKITYFHWCLCFVTFATASLTPLLKYLTNAPFREELRNGTALFPHVSSSWMPFDKYHSPGCWFTVVWHVLIYAYGGMIMGGYDSSVGVLLMFFAAKLEILRYRCKNMFGNNGPGISDEEALQLVGDFHRTHVKLTEYARLFSSLGSPVMFVYVVTFSIMICATAIHLTLANNATQVLTIAEFFIFGVTQLFLFCWHSNIVLVRSQDLSFGPYESEWWYASVLQKKAVLLLAGQFRINYVFSAGPFTNLTIPTFATIMKGAYSYYALLRK